MLVSRMRGFLDRWQSFGADGSEKPLRYPPSCFQGYWGAYEHIV